MYTEQTLNLIEAEFNNVGINTERHSDHRLLLISRDVNRVQGIMFNLIRRLAQDSRLESTMACTTIVEKFRMKTIDRLIEIYEI